MENTTIQISKKLKAEIDNRKFVKAESYEEVLWNLLEDTAELSKETEKEINEARKEFKKGKFYTFEQVKKEAGL